MNKPDFIKAVVCLRKGDRVRLQLREGCFKPTEHYDGSWTGKVFETGPGMITLAVAREGLKHFTFYPIESITRLTARRASA